MISVGNSSSANSSLFLSVHSELTLKLMVIEAAALLCLGSLVFWLWLIGSFGFLWFFILFERVFEIYLLSPLPQMPTTYRAKPSWNQKSQHLIQVSYMGGRDPITWPMTCCLSECALARSWNWEPTQDCNQGTPIWDAGILSDVLTAGSSAHPCWLCFSIWPY